MLMRIGKYTMAGRTIWQAYVADGELERGCAEGCLAPVLMIVLVVGFFALLINFPAWTIAAVFAIPIWLIFIKRWD